MRHVKCLLRFVIAYGSSTAADSYSYTHSSNNACEDRTRICRTCSLGCDGNSNICDSLPALTIAPRKDGIGAITLHIIGGLAYAAQLGLRFNGALAIDYDIQQGYDNDKVPHGVNRSVIFNALFGDSNSVYVDRHFNHPKLYKLKLKKYPALTAKLLRPNNRDDTAAMNASLAQLKLDIGEHKAGLYYLPTSDCMPPAPLFTEFVSEVFLSALRQDAACGLKSVLQKHSFFDSTSTILHANPLKLYGKENRRVVTVAVHVRRGDLYESNKLIKERLVDDEYYFQVVSAIRHILEPSGIQLQAHAWTSCTNEAQCQHARSSGTRAYRQQGIHLHVDAEYSSDTTLDTLVAWSHFAHADVLVMSPSSFSQVPALLNPRCVVFASRWRQRHGRFEQRYPALSTWIDFRTHFTQTSNISTDNRSLIMREKLTQALPKCLPLL